MNNIELRKLVEGLASEFGLSEVTVCQQALKNPRLYERLKQREYKDRETCGVLQGWAEKKRRALIARSGGGTDG